MCAFKGFGRHAEHMLGNSLVSHACSVWCHPRKQIKLALLTICVKLMAMPQKFNHSALDLQWLCRSGARVVCHALVQDTV